MVANFRGRTLADHLQIAPSVYRHPPGANVGNLQFVKFTRVRDIDGYGGAGIRWSRPGARFGGRDAVPNATRFQGHQTRLQRERRRRPACALGRRRREREGDHGTMRLCSEGLKVVQATWSSAGWSPTPCEQQHSHSRPWGLHLRRELHPAEMRYPCRSTCEPAVQPRERARGSLWLMESSW
jgi:hypothetical protein